MSRIHSSSLPYRANHWKQKVKVLVAQSFPILCDPMDCSLPGSSVHGISQTRMLEWIAMPSSRSRDCSLSHQEGQGKSLSTIKSLVLAAVNFKMWKRKNSVTCLVINWKVWKQKMYIVSQVNLCLTDIDDCCTLSFLKDYN